MLFTEIVLAAVAQQRIYILQYKKHFLGPEICHCYHESPRYHSNELSSVVTLHERCYYTG
jgi:hypothetical protein